MKRLVFLATVVCLIVALAGVCGARERRHGQPRFYRPWSPEEFVDPEMPQQELLCATAAVDTYYIVCYDFEQMNWQGWTRVDLTAQVDTFWHVEDYLEPELSGLPGPLEGLKSMWCGAPPGPEEYLCRWEDAPGYGNNWNQSLWCNDIPFTGHIVLSYKGYFDCEPDFDAVTIEYDGGAGHWVEIATYDGTVDTIAEHHVYTTQYKTKFRFRFNSDNMWSDEDGLWNTNGAAHIDSITIADDAGVIDYEDFESTPDNATASGIWFTFEEDAFGMYSGLYNNLQDKDPCGYNYTTQIVFFIGSGPYPSESYPWPGHFDTPFCKGPGGITAPCQNEIVVSPIIDMTKYSTGRNEVQDADIPPGKLPDLGGAHYRYTAYLDNPVQNLVFPRWGFRGIVNGCPGNWDGPDYLFPYQPTGEYVFMSHEIGHFITTDSIQVHLGIIDMCDVWYGIYGNCGTHTPAPWYDNVKIVRYDASGPHFSHRRLDLFQDNFPGEEFDLESWVRADAANDLRPIDEPVIDPGDSVAITCSSPNGGGIRYSYLGPDSLPEVRMHVRCRYVGCDEIPKPDIAGPALEGTYGKYESDDGVWTVIRCEEARYGGIAGLNKYAADLNDSLLTRGYRIDYYFSATDNAGKTNTLPHDALENWVFFEFSCLPTLCSDILYVDDFDGRGSHLGMVESYFDLTFKGVLPLEPDRFDVNGPSSCVSNGLGSRAKLEQMKEAYRTVIWDSGNLDHCTISDGTMNSDKSDDCGLLVQWIEHTEGDVALWVLGDDVASDLGGSAAPDAIDLMSNMCGVSLVDGSYYSLHDLMSPKVKGLPPGPFYDDLHEAGDSFCVMGGCPLINRFDCLGATAGGWPALEYGQCLCHEGWAGSGHYAAIASQYVTSTGFMFSSVWCGFSYMYIGDCVCSSPIARLRLFESVMDFFEVSIVHPVGDDDTPTFVYSLSQNYPNPFNPQTTIRFSLRDKGTVTLRIYDVAGRLVKTLVDEVRDAGAYIEPWDGRNNRGARIASGVYFYKMESRHFSRTRKMVLLR
jgi:hypothetical protein